MRCVNVIAVLCLQLRLVSASPPSIERWGRFEATFAGPTEGNPFTDVTLTATFTQGATTRDVTGFYDGGGLYRVRFMPDTLGTWRYITHSNRPALDAQTGAFVATAPTAKNHGPVGVHAVFHFAYADGTPYRELGTTCYAWIHQPEALEEQTLRTLATAPFNKLRMCVFPKYYDWNHNEPPRYPFAGAPPTQWDFTRFNPAFFQHLDQRIAQLRDLGIEADVILFHPYDKGHWGFDRMDPASDDRYLRYVLARLSAYRNVWWSLANEYDFMKAKTEADWDRFFQIVQHDDPYGHLRSIHNGSRLYNHTLPWVTHVSVQNGAAVLDSERAMLLRDVYRKPIVFDEVKYEGDIPRRWGHLTAQELVLRFWEGLIAGVYVGHGETYLHPDDDVLWWSKGGVLRGQSSARLAYLRDVMADMPRDGVDPIDKWQDAHTAGVPGEYYLIYFGNAAPASWPFRLYKDGVQDGRSFHVDVLDTWNMTTTPVPGTFVARRLDDYTFADASSRSVPMPSRPYLAIRIRRIGGSK